MGVVWYRLRTDVRVRWRTLALLAVLVGVGGGVALAAFAGARRTAAAVPQMLAYSRADDGDVGFGGFCRPSRVTGRAARSLAPLPGAARVLRLPQVAAFARMPYLFFSSSPSGSGLGSVNVTASADVQGFRTIDRPLMVAGRFPGVRRPFDAAVNELAAQRFHLHVGSRLTSTRIRRSRCWHATCPGPGAGLPHHQARGSRCVWPGSSGPPSTSTPSCRWWVRPGSRAGTGTCWSATRIR